LTVLTSNFGDSAKFVEIIFNTVMPGVIHECPYKDDVFVNLTTVSILQLIREPISSRTPIKGPFEIFPDGIYKGVFRIFTPQDLEGLLVKLYVKVKRGNKIFY
jgi:hypothetical protein